MCMRPSDAIWHQLVDAIWHQLVCAPALSPMHSRLHFAHLDIQRCQLIGHLE